MKIEFYDKNGIKVNPIVSQVYGPNGLEYFYVRADYLRELHRILEKGYMPTKDNVNVYMAIGLLFSGIMNLLYGLGVI